MIEKKKKYSVPIYGEVSFSIEVDATSEKDAVDVAYINIDDYYKLMVEADDFDVFWDFDRTVCCVGEGDIEEVES